MEDVMLLLAANPIATNLFNLVEAFKIKAVEETESLLSRAMARGPDGGPFISIAEDLTRESPAGAERSHDPSPEFSEGLGLAEWEREAGVDQIGIPGQAEPTVREPLHRSSDTRQPASLLLGQSLMQAIEPVTGGIDRKHPPIQRAFQQFVCVSSRPARNINRDSQLAGRILPGFALEGTCRGTQGVARRKVRGGLEVDPPITLIIGRKSGRYPPGGAGVLPRCSRRSPVGLTQILASTLHTHVREPPRLLRRTQTGE